MFKINKLGDIELYHIEFETQYEMTSTMIRMSEFYESEWETIRGHYFDIVEDYMDLYAEKFGNFTYFEDWSGYNVPGHIVREFFAMYDNVLGKKERKLKSEIPADLEVSCKTPFYLIASFKNEPKCESTINHEISHGLYYLSEQYRQMAENMKLLELDETDIELLIKKLKAWAYADEVIDDEIQAYLATSPIWWLREAFDVGENVNIIKKMKIFNKLFVSICQKHNIKPLKLASKKTTEQRERELDNIGRFGTGE